MRQKTMTNYEYDKLFSEVTKLSKKVDDLSKIATKVELKLEELSRKTIVISDVQKDIDNLKVEVNSLKDEKEVSLCGVSLATIIANVIYCVKSIKRAATRAKSDKEEFQKQLAVSKEYIETSFKNAVLPSKIKLDVSEKIEKPIAEGLAKMEDNQKEYLQKIYEENQLILKILSQFTHTKKLSEEDQDKIKEIVGEAVTEEVKL